MSIQDYGFSLGTYSVGVLLVKLLMDPFESLSGISNGLMTSASGAVKSVRKKIMKVHLFSVLTLLLAICAS